MAGAPGAPTTTLTGEWQPIIDIVDPQIGGAVSDIYLSGVGVEIDPLVTVELTGVGVSTLFEGIKFVANLQVGNIVRIFWSGTGITPPAFTFWKAGRKLELQNATSTDLSNAASLANTDGAAATSAVALWASTKFAEFHAAVDLGGDWSTEQANSEGAIVDLLQAQSDESGVLTQPTNDAIAAAVANHALYVDFVNNAVPGGMIRLSDPLADKTGAMRVSFNPHAISSITSTGDAGAEVAVENATNSNRALMHSMTFAVNQTHEITPTVKTGALIDSVSLIDYSATKQDGTVDRGALVRIQGGGAVFPVDVVYPAISARYTLSGRPAIGYPGINTDGHNDNDPIPHFVAYIPPMIADGTEKIELINASSGTIIKISELLLCSSWTPKDARNFDFGSVTVGQVVANDVLRGRYMHRRRIGLQLSRSVTISMMSESDCTYVDLLMKSARTMVFDSYPDADERRWRTMVVGYLDGEISTQQLQAGATVALKIIDTKLNDGV